jgi:hypothetical protein
MAQVNPPPPIPLRPTPQIPNKYDEDYTEFLYDEKLRILDEYENGYIQEGSQA